MKRLFLIFILIPHITTHALPFADYVITTTDLQSNLQEIQFERDAINRNIPILEMILHVIFNIPYSTLAIADFSTKQDMLGQFFGVFKIKYRENKGITSWKFNDFFNKANQLKIKLDTIKASIASSDMNNVSVVELLLHNLFNISYQELIKMALTDKNIYLKMSLANLDHAARSSLGHGNAKINALSATETTAIDDMTADTAHFKTLGLVDGQRQHGATCGSHAIANAWAIDQLLQEGTEITAANIYTKTSNFIHSKYAINKFIFSPEVACRVPHIPYFTTHNSEQDAFTKRINFLAYHNVGQKIGVHYTEKPSPPSWFSNQGHLPFMREQLETMMEAEPHVQHFIYNTNGHWILASVVQKPGTEPKVYFIDSDGGSATGDEVRSRFSLALYNNFVKPKLSST
jgi:hypothetical protein